MVEKMSTENTAEENGQDQLHEGIPILPIAGIVASAGGLEAYKRFFKAMPADSGIAFVVVPHLDPNRKSLMVPLLAKQTEMTVIEAEEEQRLEANHIYVIPPGRYLSLHHGVIRLLHPYDGKSGELAIDPFLRSLADDQQERAIGIILSGTGGYGALGLKAIKAAGGLAIVQEPTSAEYDVMPRSAINTGLADFILPPEKMPEELTRYVRHFLAETTTITKSSKEQESFYKIIQLLRSRSKFDFHAYRKPTLLRRIQRRMGLQHLQNLTDYLALLREESDEFDRLCKDLLISVTSFFRDPAMFKILETRLLPELIDRRSDNTPLRVWVPGCATGEEAYSIAILLLEGLDAVDKPCPLQVFASDVNEQALEIARRGVYPQGLLTDLDNKRLTRFFTKIDKSHWQVKKELRDVVVFAAQNLLSDPPFSKLDLVSCRNLLIYLEPKVQQQLLQMFHFTLKNDGLLILGPSESINHCENIFATVSKKWRIFQRKNILQSMRRNFPFQSVEKSSHWQHASLSEIDQRNSLSEQVRNALLEGHTPAAVVIDSRYEVLHYSGPTHLYLQQPGGVPTNALLSMVYPGLRPHIRSALIKTLQKNERVDLDGNLIKRDECKVLVRITIQPLPSPIESEALFLITFQDEPHTLQKISKSTDLSGKSETLVQQLENELKTTREKLQSAIEELESSNEELMTSNEEAMSMNEELQSTNEELETSKEELQSVNEELSTVNAQLQEKLEELEGNTNDMANLIACVDTAILFLGADYTIQRFTPNVTHLFNLIDVDLGRSISDITMRFDDPELMQDIERVLKHHEAQSREVCGEQDRWYLRRITSYRASANRLEGVVLTFTDITPMKQAQTKLLKMTETLEQQVQDRSQELQQKNNFIEAVLNTVACLVLVIDKEQRLVRFNNACETISGYKFKELEGTTDWWKLIPAKQKSSVEKVLLRLIAGEELVDHENHWLSRDGTERLISWNNTVIKDQAGEVQCIIGSGTDITEQRSAEARARRHLEEASRLQRLQTANELATMLAHEINQPLAAITMYADNAQQLLKHSSLQPDKLGDLLAQVSDQALRAGEIIRRLRTFVERGRIEIKPTDLNALIHHAYTLMKSKAISANIHLHIKTDETIPKVMADEVHIEQVLLNLMRNAIDAIRDAAMTEGTITISTRRLQDFAQVSICDSGPGIDTKAAAALFEPLYSTKPYGLGVGLRISRSLIEAHNGRLWVEPHTPGGRFHFTLNFAS